MQISANPTVAYPSVCVLVEFRLKAYIPLRRKIPGVGVGVGQCLQRQNFALEIPTCWYILALPNAKICVSPDAKLKIFVSPDANPRCQSVEYRWRWAFWRWGWRWACTFHVVYVNIICVGHPTQTCFSVEYGLKSLSLKPIFHCNAKYLASGVGIGLCPRRQNFALEIPTCWYLGANAKL